MIVVTEPVPVEVLTDPNSPGNFVLTVYGSQVAEIVQGPFQDRDDFVEEVKTVARLGAAIARTVNAYRDDQERNRPPVPDPATIEPADPDKGNERTTISAPFTLPGGFTINLNEARLRTVDADGIPRYRTLAEQGGVLTVQKEE